MGTQGVFGYIIGRKKRIMYVQYDAELLWQILVREIYVLMKHYGSKEALQEAFEKIKVIKNKPRPDDIEKCKVFAEFGIENEELVKEWVSLLRYCQKSFINILEAGYIINQKEEYGFTFLLDFNKGSVSFYSTNYDGKIINHTTCTIEEIMDFDDMPQRTYREIVDEMNERFQIWYNKYTLVNEELQKLNLLKLETKKQGAANIEDKIQKLIGDIQFQKSELNRNRRVLYHRLKALDLIEEDQIV